MTESIELDEFSIYKGDCFDHFHKVSDSSVSLILNDPPYGITSHAWDTVLDLDQMWKEYNRVLVDGGVCLLFCTFKFGLQLINSAPSNWFKYELIWLKNRKVNAINGNRMPMREHETILVFSKPGAPMKYFPQMEFKYNKKRNNRFKTLEHRLAKGLTLKPNMQHTRSLAGFAEYKEYDGVNYASVLKFDCVWPAAHPTEKPVPLLSTLIQMYSEEGDVVLDNTMGSGSTGAACMETNRKFIGMELTEQWFTHSADKLLAYVNSRQSDSQDQFI